LVFLITTEVMVAELPKKNAPAGGGNGRHGFLTQPFRQPQECKPLAAMPGFLFANDIDQR
jgi:hypothetical protein